MSSQRSADYNETNKAEEYFSDSSSSIAEALREHPFMIPRAFYKIACVNIGINVCSKEIFDVRNGWAISSSLCFARG